MQTNDSISSSQIENTKINSPPNRQLNDELNSQQGKRKYSLSQYQEHKRLKSNDVVQNSSADIDMRINTMENIKVRITIENFKSFEQNLPHATLREGWRIFERGYSFGKHVLEGKILFFS
jgi:hypothetical protein